MKRSELYELVWKAPMTKVSMDLQLSGVGLAKVCRRYGIPVPPRGYWAKLKAGQKPKRVELPRRTEDELIVIAPRPAIPERPQEQDPLVELLQRAAESAAQIQELVAMPLELGRTHPLVSATSAYCRQLPGIIAKYELTSPQRRWDSNVRRPPEERYGRINYYEAEGLDVFAAISEMDWVLRFHHGLFAALGSQRVTFRREQGKRQIEGLVWAELKGERLRIQFSQGYSRKQIDAAEYAKARKESVFAREYRYEAVDRMSFVVEGSESATRRTWTGSRRQMEERMTEIANTCLRFFEVQPVARAQREESARRARMREERVQERRRKTAAQREQLDVAAKLAATVASHEAVRGVLGSVKERAKKLDPPERERVEAWIDVVEDQLRRADPIEALLSNVTNHAWRYGEAAWWPSRETLEEEIGSGSMARRLLLPDLYE